MEFFSILEEASPRVKEEMRIVIHDNKIKKFIHIEELEIKRCQHVGEKSCLNIWIVCLNSNSFRDGKWYDASRYVRFSQRESRSGEG